MISNETSHRHVLLTVDVVETVSVKVSVGVVSTTEVV